MTPIHLSPTAAPRATDPSDPAAKAAQEFEALFVAQMLRGLERSTRLGGESSGAGQSTYGSLVVEAMSDAIAAGGGMGLGNVILQSLEPAAPEGPPAQRLSRT